MDSETNYNFPFINPGDDFADESYDYLQTLIRDSNFASSKNHKFPIKSDENGVLAIKGDFMSNGFEEVDSVILNWLDVPPGIREKKGKNSHESSSVPSYLQSGKSAEITEEFGFRPYLDDKTRYFTSLPGNSLKQGPGPIPPLEDSDDDYSLDGYNQASE